MIYHYDEDSEAMGSTHQGSHIHKTHSRGDSLVHPTENTCSSGQPNDQKRRAITLPFQQHTLIDAPGNISSREPLIQKEVVAGRQYGRLEETHSVLAEKLGPGGWDLLLQLPPEEQNRLVKLEFNDKLTKEDLHRAKLAAAKAHMPAKSPKPRLYQTEEADGQPSS